MIFISCSISLIWLIFSLAQFVISLLVRCLYGERGEPGGGTGSVPVEAGSCEEVGLLPAEAGWGGGAAPTLTEAESCDEVGLSPAEAAEPSVGEAGGGDVCNELTLFWYILPHVLGHWYVRGGGDV